EITRLLPIWFHLGAEERLNKLNNYYYAECLRERHKVRTLGEMEAISSRSSLLHRQNKDCICTYCESDRSNLGCKKPYKCKKLAKDILKCIKPKWDPNFKTTTHIPILSPDKITANNEAVKKGGAVTFQPALPTPASISNGFRIFTLKMPQSDRPAEQAAPSAQVNKATTLEIVVANKCIVDKNGDLISGGGVWFNNADDRNMSLKMSEDMAANNGGLVLTMLKVIKTIPKNMPISIR
ncbi:hypothetical protein F4604DRAFT_1517677, partial [Suillus subluteus]